MNRKQLVVVWLLAGWLALAFVYAARHVEEPGVWDRTKATVSREEAPAPVVNYQFVWERDAGTFLMLAVPGLLVAVPVILTLGRKK